MVTLLKNKTFEEGIQVIAFILFGPMSILSYSSKQLGRFRPSTFNKELYFFFKQEFFKNIEIDQKKTENLKELLKEN